ncbi:hypothetical protein SASPL_150877 [Salvia splendens]|uniref:Malic enzyme n=1 Tax=Salvia splendens TaxID=180675 RepID=A0A8X8W862_SALSN|nr:hypothetical protein SASPL_150877 [Salvia splendens]
MLRDPRHNKGLAFSEKERDAHYLKGLLPPAVISQELQEKRLLQILLQYTVPLHKYMAMMDLQERNERLFYKLLIDNVEELLPVVYTPVVGEACQKYGSIFRGPQGLYISLKEKGRILEVLRNWPEKAIQVIVVTDGERILGLGDLGCQGMGIPVGKLSLYTALGGVRPSANRATGQEYAELLEEFMTAVKQNYLKTLQIITRLIFLAKYRTTHLVFNDDIQGTAAVESQCLNFSRWNRIAELIALEMSKRAKTPVEETRKKIWLVDSKSLFSHFKLPWAHEHEPVRELLDAVKKPLILALSNPTSQSECTAEEAYTWSEGRAIFASGSPFPPVEYNGKTYVSGQSNNAYIFPGFGLGLIMSGTIRVHDDLLLAASEALAAQATEENYAKGLIYPPFTGIRKISAQIAATVAAKAYDLGLATRLPRPKDLMEFAQICNVPQLPLSVIDDGNKKNKIIPCRERILVE